MVSDKTHHHPMGAQLKAYDYSTLQTRYNKRFTHINKTWKRDSRSLGVM